MTFGGGALLVNGDGPLMWIFAPGSLACLAVAALGLIPFPLPRFMYPEWQMEKRRARAEAAARDAGMDDEPVRSTGRHAAEPRKPRPRGPGRHVK